MATSRRYGRIVNNFLHDVATGTWVASLLVLWVLSRRLDGMPPDAYDAVADAMAVVFWLAVVAVAVIFITGAFRLTYWKEEAEVQGVEATRRALVLKHIAFFIIYGAGTVWAWTLVPW
jgi:putative copper export protein